MHRLNGLLACAARNLNSLLNSLLRFNGEIIEIHIIYG